MDIIDKIKTFLKEVFVEMKKVNWLNRQQLFQYTMIVIGVSLAVAAFLGGLDFLFNSLIRKIIFK